jgi:hypothetical protein
MRIDSRAHHSQKWIEKTRNLNSNPFNSLSISLCSKDNFLAKFQFLKGPSHASKTMLFSLGPTTPGPRCTRFGYDGYYFLPVSSTQKIGQSPHILRLKSLKFPYLDTTFPQVIKTKQAFSSVSSQIWIFPLVDD